MLVQWLVSKGRVRLQSAEERMQRVVLLSHGFERVIADLLCRAELRDAKRRLWPGVSKLVRRGSYRDNAQRRAYSREPHA